MRIVYKLRGSCLEVLHKKYLFRRCWKVFMKAPAVASCFNKMAKPVTTKIGLHHSCFPGNFPKPVEQSFHYL